MYIHTYISIEARSITCRPSTRSALRGPGITANHIKHNHNNNATDDIVTTTTTTTTTTKYNGANHNDNDDDDDNTTTTTNANNHNLIRIAFAPNGAFRRGAPGPSESKV